MTTMIIGIVLAIIVISLSAPTTALAKSEAWIIPQRSPAAQRIARLLFEAQIRPAEGYRPGAVIPADDARQGEPRLQERPIEAPENPSRGLHDP
jgi:hypothetical protein